MKKTKSRLSPALLGAGALLAAAAVAPVYAGHGGSSSPELDVVGQLSAAALGIPGGENVTDVWAYGNYAYLGTFDDGSCSLDFTGVHIVDIADPASPAKVGFIPSPPGSRANDVKVNHIETPYFTGEVLVYSNEDCGSGFNPRLHARGSGDTPGNGGIAIYDVTDPSKPRVLKQNYLKFPVHNTFTWQQGENAYMLVVDDVNEQDVHVIDITKPWSPREIAVTGQLDWPDGIAAEFGEGAGVFLHDVWVQENDGRFIAYLSYWDAGLVLLDVTDPASPSFMGDSAYTAPDPLSGEFPAGDGHVAVPNADGTRVLLGDEDFAAGSLTSFSFEGTDYAAAEGGFTKPVFTLPGAAFSGIVVWTGGQGCTADAIPTAPDSTENVVALIQRGTCFFQDKAEAAEAKGYDGFIVANDAARGDEVFTMGARDDGPYPQIPGVFVGYSTGEAMKTAAVGALGGTTAMTGVYDGYGYLRLLDVSDPANIAELDQFATEGVFGDPTNLPPGDRTMHNIVVDGGTNAYISWYAEGMRVVRFANDTLIEVAHFVDFESDENGDPMVDENGHLVSLSNFWGVYLHDHPDGNTYVLGSDRNTGLWIFEKP